MAKRILIAAMAMLFCFSIFLTGCGAGGAEVKPGKESEQISSSASSGTAASGISSTDESSAAEATEKPGGTASSEASGNQSGSAGSEALPSGSQGGPAGSEASPSGSQSGSAGSEALPSGSQSGSAGSETAPSGSQSGTAGSEAPSEPGTGQNNENVKQDYFLAGSFNGYIANDVNFQMKPVPGSQTWYTYTVRLTEDNRDALYDGHWYKVTTGDWNAPSYGIDNYCIEDPPVKRLDDGTAIGLGSIWVDENIELTVLFDSVNKIVYDNANGKSLPTP